MQILDSFHHIFAESLAIGKWIAFVEKAAGNTAPKVLDEVAV